MCARITDANGHTRFAYSKRVTLTAAAKTRAFARADDDPARSEPPVPGGREPIRLAELA